MSAAKRCLSTGISRSRCWISVATNSKSAEAAYVAANAQRDQAEAAIKAAEADVERLQVNSGRSGARVAEKLDACSTGLPAPARWLPQDSAF